MEMEHPPQEVVVVAVRLLHVGGDEAVELLLVEEVLLLHADVEVWVQVLVVVGRRWCRCCSRSTDPWPHSSHRSHQRGIYIEEYPSPDRMRLRCRRSSGCRGS